MEPLKRSQSLLRGTRNGDVAEVWDEVTTRAGRVIPSAETWLSTAEPISLEGGTLTVSVPTEYDRDGLEHRIGGALKSALVSLVGPDASLVVVSDDRGGPGGAE